MYFEPETTSSSSDASSYDGDSDSTTNEMYDDENDFIIDQIYENEFSYNNTILRENSSYFHKKYFIGICKYVPNENILLFINMIHPNNFFQYKLNLIYKYFFWYSGIHINMNRPPPIEIIKVIVFPDETYTCVLKTYYIRIIQRRWKKVFKERQCYISERKTLQSLWDYSIGKRTCKHSFPGLKGLLVDCF
jgi:hypothetical protein